MDTQVLDMKVLRQPSQDGKRHESRGSSKNSYNSNKKAYNKANQQQSRSLLQDRTSVKTDNQQQTITLVPSGIQTFEYENKGKK